jgi:hypothetical protein
LPPLVAESVAALTGRVAGASLRAEYLRAVETRRARGCRGGGGPWLRGGGPRDGAGSHAAHGRGRGSGCESRGRDGQIGEGASAEGLRSTQNGTGWVGLCGAGKIYSARVAVGSSALAERRWAQRSNSQCWNEARWTASPSPAAQRHRGSHAGRGPRSTGSVVGLAGDGAAVYWLASRSECVYYGLRAQ